MIPSEDEGDIPYPPGYLFSIGEESSVGPSAQDLRDIDAVGTTGPILGACESVTYVRSPVLLTSQTPSQEIVGAYQVEPTPR